MLNNNSNSPKHITMNKLPAKLLLRILSRVDLVVPRQTHLKLGPTTSLGDYLAMSLCNVLRSIMATIPERKRTMTSELRMENHWMLVCGMLSKM